MQFSRIVAVVLPAHNEASVIGSVIANIPPHILSMSVRTIVVDDGSTDATARVARQQGAMVVRHLANLGVGAATVTGLLAAEEIDADIVVTMDSDGQHDPGEIGRLVKCLVDGPYDVVIGSRLLHSEGMPFSRVAANLLLNAVTYVVYRKIVSDSHSGFRVFSRDALARTNLRSAGYEVCSVIIGEIYRQKLCYKSEQVRAVYTTYSQGKGQPFLNGINIILGLLMRLVRRV